jgi:hypothetical protein
MRNVAVHLLLYFLVVASFSGTPTAGLAQSPAVETLVLTPVRQIDGDKFGYIDDHGNVMIGFQFDMASDFHEGLAEVHLNGKCGYIDTQGKLAIPYQRCHLFGDFHEGFAVVSFKQSGKEYFMDAKGRLLKCAGLDYAQPFSEGLAAVNGKVEGKWGWGYIDKDGRFVIPPKFEDYLGNFSEGVAYARLGGKVGFIDKQGEFVISPRFDQAADFSEGLAAVRLGSQWGFIDHRGEFVIRPQFAWALWFSEGLAAACTEKGKTPYEDKAGYIDRQGHWVVEPKYQKTSSFQGGRGEVEKEGHFGLVDSSGKEVVPAQYLDAFYVGFGLWYGRTVNESHTAPESRIIDKQGNVVYRYDHRSPRCVREHPPFPSPDQVSVTLEPAEATVRVGATVPFHVVTHGFTEFIFFDWETEDKDGHSCLSLSNRKWSSESCPMGYLRARHYKRHGANVEETATYFAPKLPGTYYVYALAWQSEQCEGIRRVEKRVTAVISVIP